VNSPVSRDAVQTSFPVVSHVLAGVEHIEPPHPNRTAAVSTMNARIQRTADGIHAAAGAIPRARPAQMRPAGDSLGVGVEQNHRERRERATVFPGSAARGRMKART